ncbi:Uncharacterized protein PCOAH_00016740 [Plasmodium coatneyi]|uniref:Uncharacterized protein n=1 Tax=Plasmodium coatneyi TaxID=208452 RepID=A0A1B1DXN7_9APIC|nr:Uncharacterized protein PCOAH_00016740 [Plasmodium coatneyi]ANQ07543.1 Uncharacterized protein PCOAH_00016740 [Plasmodium coatneyi]
MNTDLTTKDARTAEEKSPFGRLTFSELAQLSDYLKPDRNNEMSLLEGKRELPAENENYMNKSAEKKNFMENYELASQNAGNSEKIKKKCVCSDKSCIADSCLEQAEQSYNPRNKLVDEEENNNLKSAKWYVSNGHDPIQGGENLPICESHVSSSLTGEQNVLAQNDQHAHNNLSSNSTRIDSSDVFSPTMENRNSVKKECASHSPSISNSRMCECNENGKSGQGGSDKERAIADMPVWRRISGLSLSGGNALGKEGEEVDGGDFDGDEEGEEERDEEPEKREDDQYEDEQIDDDEIEEDQIDSNQSEGDQCEDDQSGDEQSGDEQSGDEQSDEDQRKDEEVDIPINPTTTKEKRLSQGSRSKNDRAAYTKREEQITIEKKNMSKERTNKYKDNLNLFNEVLKHKSELSYFHHKMMEDDRKDEQDEGQDNHPVRGDERVSSTNVVKLRQNGNAHLWNSSCSNAGACSGKYDVAQVGVRSNNSTYSALNVGKNASFSGGRPASEKIEENGDDMNDTAGSIELGEPDNPRDASSDSYRSSCSRDHVPSKGTQRGEFNGTEKERNEKKSLQKKRNSNLYSYLLLENKKTQVQKVDMKINVRFKNIYFVKYKSVKCVVTNNSGVVVHSFTFCKNGTDFNAQNRILKMYNKDKDSFNLLHHDEVQVLLEELKKSAHTDVTFELLFDAQVVNGRVEISSSTFYRLSFYGVEEVPQKGVDQDAKGTNSRETSAKLTKGRISTQGRGISGKVTNGKVTNHFATKVAIKHSTPIDPPKGATDKSAKCSTKCSVKPVTKLKEEKEKNSYIGFTILHLKYLFQMQEKGSIHLNISNNNNEEFDFVKNYNKEEYAQHMDGKAAEEMYSNSLSYVDKIGMLFKILFGHSLNISSQKVFLQYQFALSDVHAWHHCEGDFFDRHSDFKSALEMVQKGSVSNQLETKKGMEECLKNYLKNCSQYIYDEITISLLGLSENNGNHSDRSYCRSDAKSRCTCGRPPFCNSPGEATIQGSFPQGGKCPYAVCSVASREGSPHREVSKIMNGGCYEEEEVVKRSIHRIAEACLPDSCETSQRLKPHLVNLLNWLHKKNEKSKKIETLEHILRKYTTGFNDYLDFVELSNSNKAYKVYEENKRLKEYIKNCNGFFIDTLMRNHQEIQKLKHRNKTVNILYNRERMSNLGKGGGKRDSSMVGIHSDGMGELDALVELDRLGAINFLEKKNDIFGSIISRRPVGNLSTSVSTVKKDEQGCLSVCPDVTRQDSQSGSYHVGGKLEQSFSKRNFATDTVDGSGTNKQTDLLHRKSDWAKKGGLLLQNLQGRNRYSKSSPQLSSFSAFRFGNGGELRTSRSGRSREHLCSHSCHLERGKSRGGQVTSRGGDDQTERTDQMERSDLIGPNDRRHLLKLYSNPIGAALLAHTSKRKEHGDVTTGSLIKSSKETYLHASTKWTAWKRRTVGGQATQGSRNDHVGMNGPSSSAQSSNHEIMQRPPPIALKKKNTTARSSQKEKCNKDGATMKGSVHTGGHHTEVKNAEKSPNGECNPSETRPHLQSQKCERGVSTTNCRNKKGSGDTPQGGGNHFINNPKGSLLRRTKNNYDTSEVLKKEYFNNAKMGSRKKGQTLPNYEVNLRSAKGKGKANITEGKNSSSSENKSGESKVTHVREGENASVTTLRGDMLGVITGRSSTPVGRSADQVHVGRKATDTVVTLGGANKTNHMDNVDYKKRYIEKVISTYEDYIPVKTDRQSQGRKICTVTGSSSRVQSRGGNINGVIYNEGVLTQKKSRREDNAIKSIKEIIENNVTRKSSFDLNGVEKKALLKNLHNSKISSSVYLHGVKAGGGGESHPKTVLGGEKRRAPTSKDAYILDIINKNLNKSFSQLDRIKKKMSEHLVV